MFNKKKQVFKNPYERQWNNIMDQRIEIMERMLNLYTDIQRSNKVTFCFEEGTPNWKAEIKHLKDLRYKLLCVCGTYDSLNNDLTQLWNNHNEDLRSECCKNLKNLVVYSLGDCNVFLRSIANIIDER
jgi:predicted helicase